MSECITTSMGRRNGRFVHFSLSVEISEDRPESFTLVVDLTDESRVFDLSDIPQRLRSGLLQILADLTEAPGVQDVTHETYEGEVH